MCCVGSKLKGLVGSMLRVLGTLGLKGSECLGLGFRIQAFRYRALELGPQWHMWPGLRVQGSGSLDTVLLGSTGTGIRGSGQQGSTLQGSVGQGSKVKGKG